MGLPLGISRSTGNWLDNGHLFEQLTNQIDEANTEFGEHIEQFGQEMTTCIERTEQTKESITMFGSNMSNGDTNNDKPDELK